MNKKNFKDLFNANNYSEEALINLLDGVWYMHEFTSKFLHEIPKNDELDKLNPIPIPYKEDGYFVYCWMYSFVNLILSKAK